MALSAGTRLGPYEIVALLGAGGMGEVYRARDAKLKRDVAIKVLPQSMARDPDALARFEREALAIAALSHPNILAIHGFEMQDGVVYAVMELLEGETLRGRLEAGPIGWRQASDWALQIARGLSAAHEKGIVHRDLKPENIFVVRGGHLKILDFGLAKRVPAAAGTQAPTVPGLTEPGAVMGTVSYMSPEQVRGLAVDHRSDIFSFGVILYEMLSGRRAFRKDTVPETMAAILREEPPELSASGRDIPIALDHVVMHCLEKNREDRFQAAKDVVFALSEASSGARMAGAAPPRMRKTGIRAALVASVVATALALGAGVFLFRRSHETPTETVGVQRVAVLPFENLGAPEDDYFADGIADEVRGKLTSIPGLQVIARASSTPYKKTAKTPKQIAGELNASYLLTATVRWEKSGATSRVHVSPELVDVTHPDAPISKWQQPFDASLTDVFQVQSTIASKVAQALGVALGAGEERRLSEKPTSSLPAYDAYLKGRQADNGGVAGDPPSLRKALDFYEQAVALDPGFAQAWADLSMTESLLYGNSTPTPQLAERALQAAEKAVALAPDRPEGYQALGSYRRLVVGDPRGAQEHYAKARRLGPGQAEILSGGALNELHLGEWHAAVEHLKQAERLDPRSVTTVQRLGEALLRLRRYAEARETFDRGLALEPTDLGLIEGKVMLLLGEGDLPGARAFLRTVPGEVAPTSLVAFLATYWDLVWVLDEGQCELLLRLTPSAFDDDEGIWALCLTQAYALRGDAAGVRVHAEEARQAFQEQLRAAPDDVGRHFSLGLSLGYLGRKEEAIREGRRGIELLPVAKDAFNGPYYQHQLVRIYMLVGEPQKALAELEPLLKIPCMLSPGWLAIDPNFDPLRSYPEFRRLLAGKSEAAGEPQRARRTTTALATPLPALRGFSKRATSRNPGFRGARTDSARAHPPRVRSGSVDTAYTDSPLGRTTFSGGTRARRSPARRMTLGSLGSASRRGVRSASTA
jgi:TolB-like protein/Flp pilus assembly protein TadD